MKTLHVSLENGRSLCVVELADGHWTRFRGLLGRKSLPADRGLLIKPCKSVHTFFMQFPIDVVYLNRDQEIVKLRPGLVPSRLSSGAPGAHAVLELAGSTIERTGLQVGQHLQIRAEQSNADQLVRPGAPG